MEIVLGNEKLSLLTMNKKYKLRIELEDFLGGKRWAEYSTFSVKPSTDKYRLTVAGYSGNAGSHYLIITSVNTCIPVCLSLFICICIRYNYLRVASSVLSVFAPVC